MTAGMTRAREVGLELARMLAALFWVSGASAACLAGLGAIPRWIAGDGTGARPAASVEDAERRVGGRVLLPAVFPERLAWPPSAIRVAGGRGGSVSLVFTDHHGRPALEIVEATEAGVPVAPELLRGRTIVSSRRTILGARPATLAAVLVDGEPWQELAWELRGRAILLRTRGDVDELYRIAHSAHEEGR
jgi:hypothetical protein